MKYRDVNTEQLLQDLQVMADQELRLHAAMRGHSNKCVIIAICNAVGADYDRVYKLVEAQCTNPRADDAGYCRREWMPVLQRLAAERGWKVQRMPVEAIRPLAKTTKTFASRGVPARINMGRGIVWSTGHLSAVVHHQLVDWAVSSAKHLKGLWRLVDETTGLPV